MVIMKIQRTEMYNPDFFTREELYMIRMLLWQLQTSKYSGGDRILSTIYNVECHIDVNADDSADIHLVAGHHIIFSYNTNTGLIDFDSRLLPLTLAPLHPVGGSLGMTLCLFLDALVREHMGATKFAFQTMTKKDTKKVVHDFYGLVKSVAFKSARDIEFKEHRLTTYGDGYALFGPDKMLIFAVYEDSIDLGFISDVNLNKLIKEKINAIRPLILDMRDTYNHPLEKLEELFVFLWNTKEMIRMKNVNAAKFLNAEAPDSAFVVTIEGTNFHISDDLLVMDNAHGWANYKPNCRPEAESSMLDWLRTDASYDELRKLFVAATHRYADLMQYQIGNIPNPADLVKLGLTREQYPHYLSVYLLAKKRGYPGDLEHFVNLTKLLKA